MKNFIKPILGFQWLCLLCLCESSLPAFAQAPTNGLVAYYPFNGNANDASGNGNNGTINGATLTTDRFGNANKAYDFNGIDQFINVANGTAFNFDSTNAFSVNVWINPKNAQSAFAGIIDKSHTHAANGGALKGFVIQKSNTSLAFYGGYGCGSSYCGSNTVGEEVGHNIPVTPEAWNMLTMTVQNGILGYYLNGNLIVFYEQTTNHSVVGNGNLPLIIGAVNGGGRYFNGKIDDIRIYNRALSQTEVSQLYLAENSRLVCTNPVGQPTHTASFNYDISTGAASMRFGDGQTASLTGTSGTITHAYNKTGIYYAELLKDNVPIDTVAVTVKTCGWISTLGSGYDPQSFMPSSLCDNVSNGRWHIPNNPLPGEQWTIANRFQNYNITGDAASFEIRARNALAEGSMWCQDLALVIYGNKSKASVAFMDGCPYWTFLNAGRTSIPHNINELSRSLTDYHTFKLQTENHIAKVFYDSVLIYSMPYEGEIGNVIGIGVSFKGLGSIDWAEVRANGAATATFREDFTTCNEANVTSTVSNITTTTALASWNASNSVYQLSYKANDETIWTNLNTNPAAKVTLYDGANYQGQNIQLNVGNFRFPQHYNFNDMASSIKIQTGYRAKLYVHAGDINGVHYGYGDTLILTADMPNLATVGVDNTISFVEVTKIDNAVSDTSARFIGLRSGTNYTIRTITYCGVDSTIVNTNFTTSSCVSQITSDAPNNQLNCFTPNALLTPRVTTGGVAPYTYRWDNNSTDSVRRVHRSGTYRVTITDANGCISSSSIALTSESSRIELGFLPDTMPILTCLNQSVRIQIPDSTLLRLNEFRYRIWLNGNLLTQGNAPAYPLNSLFNVDAVLGGTYDFEFTPLATGCTVTGRLGIIDARNRLNGNDFRISAPTTTLNCTTTSIPLSVVGANGNPLLGYTYAWTNTDFTGSTSHQRNITAAGTYSAWVINPLTNCRSLLPQTIEIQQNIVPPTVSITASNPNFTCGIPNITLTATGATTYVWNDNGTTNPKSIQNIGTYTVTGTSANGCTNTANVPIGQTAGVIRLPQVNRTICQGNTLTLGNQTFTTAGDYTILKTGTLGCDTTYTLRLSIEDSTYRQAISIAAGTSFTIGNSTYSQSGTYVNRVASPNGCTRNITTVLTVLPVGTPLDSAYRMPNVVIPCPGRDFCVEITHNNLNSNIKGWQGAIQYPSNCLQYTGGYKGSAIGAGFSNFVADSANREVRFAIAPSAHVASIGTIAQVCFQVKTNAICNAPYSITATPVLESFTDNAQNRFVTVRSSRITTTIHDTVNVSLFYANVTQAFGNLVGTGNAYTEVQSCNPNPVGVMLPNAQGKVVCKAGDPIQMKRFPNANPTLSLSAVNSMDAYKIVQFVTRDVAAGTPDGMHWRAADADGSGHILANDATAVLRIAVGLDPVQYLWLPSTQADTIGFGLNPMRAPAVSNCISMPSAGCTAQSMNILGIQRGDFWAQPVANDGKLAPLTQEIFMDLQHIARRGDTILLPIGYQSASNLIAMDLSIGLANNNRFRLVNIEPKNGTNFDQFLSNPVATLVQSSGFGSHLGNDPCILILKVVAVNGAIPQESDFTAARSLINGNAATFSFKNTLNGCVMTTGNEELLSNNIRLYPNPTLNQLTMDYNTAVQQLSIVNTLGQSLKTLEINASGHLDVDVSELPQGVYFLRINDKEMKKFVKM